MGTVITRIAGKLGGVVFCNTNNGVIVKNNSYSLPQFSQLQTAQQTRISFVSSRWLLLSNTQKNSWANQVINYPFYNKVGELSYYNGYQLFLYLNNNLHFSNLPININSPVYEVLARPVFYISELSENQVEMGYIFGKNNHVVRVYCTDAKTVDTVLKVSDYKYFTTQEVGGTSDIFEITIPFLEKFGQIIYGKRYGFAFNCVNKSTGESTGISGFTAFVAPY